MFGLMKSRSCSLTLEQRLNRRLHYCGTCKTMGRLYGQRTRFLLNHDAVFLAELLSAISGGDSQLADWDRAYQSYNCLSLPASPKTMPVALQYAAAGALAIAEFKIADQITDSGRFPWTVAAGAFSKSFRQASATLVEWKFPIAELQACSLEQSVREVACAGSGAAADDRSADEILAYLEHPTGGATALFFSHGARLVGRTELQQAMSEIGFRLGSLIYLLDAYEDYDKDSRTGAFNALRAACRISEDSMSAPHRELARLRMWQMAAEIEAGLIGLPIAAERAQIFASRLRSNLAYRLRRKLPILPVSSVVQDSGTRAEAAACACKTSAGGSFADRWRSALHLGRSIVDTRRRGRPRSFRAGLEAPFVFASVMGVALLFPRQARTVSSYRECIGIAFNLMFVTALVRSILITPVRPLLFSTPVPPDPGEPVPGEPVPPRPGIGPTSPYTVGPPGEPVPPQPAPKRGCSFCCCDSDCCDSCDCCCDCGECCSGCDC